MMGLQVLKEQCPTCIFRPGNQMALKRGRVASMVRECVATQSYIPCHETMTVKPGYEDEDEPEMDGPVCRGFYDAHGEVSQMVRIAGRLGALEFVDPEPAS